jgi:DNA repair protein RecN (Recombination protein N)
MNSGDELERLNGEKKRAGGEILALCIEISKLRKAAANSVKAQLEQVLRELGMKNVRFDIAIEKKSEFGPDGYDRVEFMISPNAGEPLKPLSKIASGGEMSRVMLALKTVLADADQVETFIFDEIDAGVSGRTAQQVAEKLSLLGSKHQLLCITHLPQIASMADTHFLIEKHTQDGKTSTGITPLNRDAAVMELARLIGGAKITDATLKAAREMKDMAVELKGRG